jgi:hypothetical protein
MGFPGCAPAARQFPFIRGQSISIWPVRRGNKAAYPWLCPPPTECREKAIRFMIIVKATAESEAKTASAPKEALLAEMADYHKLRVKAGVISRRPDD